MKKLIPLILLLITYNYSFAQNVGVGITTPQYKLHVNEASVSSGFIQVTNSLTGQSLSDGLLVGSIGTNAVVANLESGDLRFGTSNLTRMTIDASGDVGIGEAIPTAKLHINGGVKVEGTNLFEFGAGVAGKEINAGKIGYNAFGTTALAFVGAGTNATNRAVYFFAEGGTTFSGPATIFGNLNFGGQLQVNGTPGASGQVLTSNGIADPTWEDAAFGNNTRFAVRFNTTDGGPGYMDLTGTEYNLNTADITISATSVTFNKTGLYRLNGSVSGHVSYPSAVPAWLPELSSSITFTGTMSDGLTLTQFEPYHKRSSVGNPNYYFTRLFSLEIHVLAGAILRVNKELHWDGSPSFFGSASLSLWGNLIAE